MNSVFPKWFPGFLHIITATVVASALVCPGHSAAQPVVTSSSPRQVVEKRTVIEFENAAELAASEGKIVANLPGYVVFEPGISGQAARFPRDEKLYSATVQFPAAIIDLSDNDGMGKKLEFRLKFNEDPHLFSGNKFLLSAYPMFMVEIYGTHPFLAFEFYGNGYNDATRGRFLTYTQGWDKWENWKVGEWHKITLVWKRNGRGGKAEMHLYIDDSQEGCLATRCNDYGGILPKTGSFKAFAVGNSSKNAALDFSIDQLRIENVTR